MAAPWSEGRSEAVYLMRGSILSLSFVEPNKPEKPDRRDEPERPDGPAPRHAPRNGSGTCSSSGASVWMARVMPRPVRKK